MKAGAPRRGRIAAAFRTVERPMLIPANIPDRLPTLGILGGMGPLATVDLMRKIIERTPAARDQEHMPMLVYNLPQIPDRSTAFLAGEDTPFEPMQAALTRLVDAGADAFAIPCNTAHVWHARLAEALPEGRVLLHIGSASLAALAKRAAPVQRVGVLATAATARSEVYRAPLAARGLEAVIPDAPTQQTISAGIAAIKGGRLDEGRTALRDALTRLREVGIDAALLACTEIPLVLDANDAPIPLIDTTDALAEACVDWWQQACATLAGGQAAPLEV